MTQFVEKGLIVSTIAVLSGLVGYLSQYFGIPASPETISSYSMALTLGTPVTMMFLVLSVIVWVDRYRIVREISKIGIESEFIGRRDVVMKPAYLLADSVDREVLASLSRNGGDISQTRLDLDDDALVPTTRELTKKLVKLTVLGLVYPPRNPPLWRIFLTSRGLDALNTPASLFVSHVPDTVWQYVFQMKVKLLEENWPGAAIAMSCALENMLLYELNSAIETKPVLWGQVKEDRKKRGKNMKPVEKQTIGELRRSLIDMGELVEKTVEDVLVLELNKVRKRIHPPKESTTASPFGPREATRADLYLDIILQSWYGPH